MDWVGLNLITNYGQIDKKNAMDRQKYAYAILPTEQQLRKPVYNWYQITAHIAESSISDDIQERVYEGLRGEVKSGSDIPTRGQHVRHVPE